MPHRFRHLSFGVVSTCLTMRRGSTHRVFLSEFVRNFHTTGSLLPSSRFLGAALARGVEKSTRHGPRRILEVGPGTGAATHHLVAALKPEDRLELVEINPRFVELLEARFAQEPTWRSVRDRVRIHCQRIEALEASEPYDAIVSGLPLNNFAVADVEQILAVFERLARPGGTLAFFEYIAIRSAKAAVSGRSERQRLQEIGRVLERFLADKSDRSAVWLNFPPAWVHYVQFPGEDDNA